MAGSGKVSVLVYDTDPESLEDYRIIFGASHGEGDVAASDGMAFEAELHRTAHSGSRLLDVQFSGESDGRAAVNSVGRALEDGRPFHVAFVDLGPPPNHWGLDVAQGIRDLDPSLHIVLTVSHFDHDPSDLCALVPPADRLSLLCKPVLPLEVQQHALSASARRVAEEGPARSRIRGAGLASAWPPSAMGSDGQIRQLADALLLVRDAMDSLFEVRGAVRSRKTGPRRGLGSWLEARLSPGPDIPNVPEPQNLPKLSEDPVPFVKVRSGSKISGASPKDATPDDQATTE